MKTKIFFSDLDSTLLTKDKKVSPLTYNALKKWTHEGNKLVLCSGRALDSIIHVRESLGLNFPNMYLIGCNGSEIYDCEKKDMLLRIPLSLSTAERIFSLAASQDVYVHTYTDTHILTIKEGEELTFYRKAVHTPYLLTNDLAKDLDKEPCKCIAIDLKNPDKLENFRKTVEKELGEELTVLYSTPYYLELFSSSSGKGSGLKWLCSHLQIPIEDSLAAGDEINDLSMIEAAGLGIAMKNARDIVKDAADVVTEEDNDHDGLVSVLLKASRCPK